MSLSSQKYGSGSGIRKNAIPDHGSSGQKGTEYQIWLRNTGKQAQKWYRMRNTTLVEAPYKAEQVKHSPSPTMPRVSPRIRAHPNAAS